MWHFNFKIHCFYCEYVNITIVNNTKLAITCENNERFVIMEAIFLLLCQPKKYINQNNFLCTLLLETSLEIIHLIIQLKVIRYKTAWGVPSEPQVKEFLFHRKVMFWSGDNQFSVSLSISWTSKSGMLWWWRQAHIKRYSFVYILDIDSSDHETCQLMDIIKGIFFRNVLNDLEGWG